MRIPSHPGTAAGDESAARSVASGCVALLVSVFADKLMPGSTSQKPLQGCTHAASFCCHVPLQLPSSHRRCLVCCPLRCQAPHSRDDSRWSHRTHVCFAFIRNLWGHGSSTADLQPPSCCDASMQLVCSICFCITAAEEIIVTFPAE